MLVIVSRSACFMGYPSTLYNLIIGQGGHIIKIILIRFWFAKACDYSRGGFADPDQGTKESPCYNRRKV